VNSHRSIRRKARKEELDRDDQVRVVSGLEDHAVEGVVGGDAVLDAAVGECGHVIGVVGSQAVVVGAGQAVGGAPGGGAVQLGGGAEGLARQLEIEGDGLVRHRHLVLWQR
jgi:hypothetical protein